MDAEREAQRARERAEKRMQTLTKEADWRVAKAYVAVASLSDSDDDVNGVPKPKEDHVDELKARLNAEGEGSRSLEARAVDRYLDDEEWEERERRGGRGVVIPRFPLLKGANRVQQITEQSRSWLGSWQR